MKLLDYIRGDRRGADAHRIELEAMSDLLLRDAIEGYDAVKGDHEAIIERMNSKLVESNTPRSRRVHIIWGGVAALFVVAGAGVLLYMQNQKWNAPTIAAVTEKPDDVAGIMMAEIIADSASHENEILPEVELSEQAVSQSQDGSPEKKDLLAVAPAAGERRENISAMQLSRSDGAATAAADAESNADNAKATAAHQGVQARRVPGEEPLHAYDITDNTIQKHVIPILEVHEEDANTTVGGAAQSAGFEEKLTLDAALMGFNRYVKTHLVPQPDSHGEVAIRFDTDKNGRCKKLRVIGSLTPEANSEARRLVESYNSWPAGQKSVEVRISFK